MWLLNLFCQLFFDVIHRYWWVSVFFLLPFIAVGGFCGFCGFFLNLNFIDLVKMNFLDPETIKIFAHTFFKYGFPAGLVGLVGAGLLFLTFRISIRMRTRLISLAEYYESPHLWGEKKETYIKRSLKIRELILGPNHPDVVATLNNLAVFYYQLRKYTEIERLLKRSLKILERNFGANHLKMADGVDALAILYKTQERFAEAEMLFERSLNIRENYDYSKDFDMFLGSYNKRANLAESLDKLAELYRVQGKYAEAESFSKRSLVIKEEILDYCQFNLKESLNKLAGLYEAQKKYSESEAIYKRLSEV